MPYQDEDSGYDAWLRHEEGRERRAMAQNAQQFYDIPQMASRGGRSPPAREERRPVNECNCCWNCRHRGDSPRRNERRRESSARHNGQQHSTAMPSREEIFRQAAPMMLRCRRAWGGTPWPEDPEAFRRLERDIFERPGGAEYVWRWLLTRRRQIAEGTGLGGMMVQRERFG
ncbi:hypothetical protein LTR09_009969 [Extremus antarcticus]|uniref:Uncharacterized protein n=1 Tax=Extremus antarcticus TaxID=702011 RepID=A0AAJ0G8R3_9PEZI|nr:hypothetical protein LTR09_009969 [Extremus antarcticus]